MRLGERQVHKDQSHRGFLGGGDQNIGKRDCDRNSPTNWEIFVQNVLTFEGMLHKRKKGDVTERSLLERRHRVRRKRPHENHKKGKSFCSRKDTWPGDQKEEKDCEGKKRGTGISPP